MFPRHTACVPHLAIEWASSPQVAVMGVSSDCIKFPATLLDPSGRPHVQECSVKTFHRLVDLADVNAEMVHVLNDFCPQYNHWQVA